MAALYAREKTLVKKEDENFKALYGINPTQLNGINKKELLDGMAYYITTVKMMAQRAMALAREPTEKSEIDSLKKEVVTNTVKATNILTASNNPDSDSEKIWEELSKGMKSASKIIEIADKYSKN